jgi:hypothetical protein
MKTYRIENRTSGVVLGDYRGEDEQAAIEAMHRDAGYHDPADVPGTSDDLDVTEVDPGWCPVCQLWTEAGPSRNGEGSDYCAVCGHPHSED